MFQFRGKDFNGNWVYGGVIRNKDNAPIIVTDDLNVIPVLPDSVQTFFGWFDVDGKRIFTGDVLYLLGKQWLVCEDIVNSRFVLRHYFQLNKNPRIHTTEMSANEINLRDMRIIGNIYQDKDLPGIKHISMIPPGGYTEND